jgi:hypothetical protein
MREAESRQACVVAAAGQSLSYPGQAMFCASLVPTIYDLPA